MISSALKSIYIREVAQPAPTADSAPNDVQPAAPQPTSAGNQGDTPASVATLGNLLKKALTLDLSEEDRFKVSRMPEITEKNATVEIPKILSIMRSYSVSIDIDANV